MSRALGALLSTPWAIEPGWLSALAQMAQRNFSAAEVEALRAARGSGGDTQRRPYAVVDGVAVIPIAGPLFPRANLLQMVSGARSIDMIEGEFRAALRDPDVAAILLDFDSPGGAVSGISELADLVHAARGTKPIAGYVRGAAASAAYWIATAVAPGELWIEATGIVGSIGIVAGVEVQEAPDQRGYRRIEVVSSNAGNKRPDPRTESGLAVLLEVLDALEARFVGAVARNRGIAAATVLERFGRGGVKVGSAAVDAGMADRVGTYDQVLSHLADLAASQRREKSSMTTNANQPAAPADPPATAESLAAAFPAQVAQIRTEAAAAERARILGVEAQSLPGHEQLVAAMKADGRTTPEQAAVAILAAEKQTGARVLAGLKVDGQAPAPAPATGQPATPAAEDASQPLEARAKAAWDASAALQAEFGGSFTRYLAFRRADDRGSVRLFKPRAA